MEASRRIYVLHKNRDEQEIQEQQSWCDLAFGNVATPLRVSCSESDLLTIGMTLYYLL